MSRASKGAVVGECDERLMVAVPLKAYFERLIEELDTRYRERFEGADRAVNAALQAQKELTSAAFASSEKAIVKAEENQRELNFKNNEFRGQLKDQAEAAARDLMPRREAMALSDAMSKEIKDLKEGPVAEMTAFKNQILGRMAMLSVLSSLVGGVLGALATSLLRK